MLRHFRTLTTQTLASVNYKGLIQTTPFINGKFIPNDGADCGNVVNFGVNNPFNMKELIKVRATKTDELNLAIDNTAKTFTDFQYTSPRWRSQLLSKLNDAILSNAEDLARIITLENGKPFADSLGEVKYGASFMEWFSEEAARVNGLLINSSDPRKQITAYKVPVGPVGILTPWNFPLAMITRKLGAAIAAGCTTIVKPAAETPLTALAFAKLCQEVGIPSGVINIVPVEEERTPLFGKIICESSKLKKVSFTGSTKVGKLLMGQCANTIKKMSMELGGNAPFIVSNKADLNKAVDGLIAAKFRSSGQTCVCVNRVYVHDEIYTEFSTLLVEKLKKNTRLGPGMDPTVTHGPLVHDKSLKKVSHLVDDAISKGAKLLLGGKSRPDLGPTFYELTVLSEVTKNMDIYETEIFGPVASLIRYNCSVDELSRGAASENSEDVGLAGYIFSNDANECRQAARGLGVGMVGVNTGAISEAALPFGGVRCSGMGREGSVYGVDEYCVIKSVVQSI